MQGRYPRGSVNDQNESWVRRVKGKMARRRSTGEPVQLMQYEFWVVRNGVGAWVPTGEVTLREIEKRIIELRRRREALDQQREALDHEIETLSAPLRSVLDGSLDDEEFDELE
jgi:hypothetical protein